MSIILIKHRVIVNVIVIKKSLNLQSNNLNIISCNNNSKRPFSNYFVNLFVKKQQAKKMNRINNNNSSSTYNTLVKNPTDFNKKAGNVFLTNTMDAFILKNNCNNLNSNHYKPIDITKSEDNKQQTQTDLVKTAKRPEQAAKIIKNSDVICFDVDSTVIKEEGIDELADFCGKGSEVARVTKEAMGGSMTFQDALKIRLNIIRPTQKQIGEFLKLHPSTLSRGLKNFVNHLKAERKDVYLVSGGFYCLIEPIAMELGIPLCNVFANKLFFDYHGEYVGFDTNQPTSHTGGKGEAIGIIKQSCPDAIVTMIGDGATDLEAVPPANNFIGFGGNIVRTGVYERAQFYVNEFEQLYTKE